MTASDRSFIRRPTNHVPSQPLKSSSEWLTEASKLLDSSTSRDSFNRESQAKFESIMAMVQATRLRDDELEGYSQRRVQRDWRRTMDPATLAFFSGHSVSDPVISSAGGRLQERSGGRQGSVLELRDMTHTLGQESRTYTALNTGTGSSGGYSIPIGFWPEVQFALRQVDGLFAAARWVITPTGNPMNFPTAFESNVGRRLAENDPAQQNNPAFGQVHFDETEPWSSDQIVLSLQFLEDCGAPNVTEVMSQIFAIRISLGLGNDFTSTLLASAATGVTTASASAITPAELIDMTTSLSNAAYAYKPTTGWLMNADTLAHIRKLVGTSGNFMFPEKFDDDGTPLLLERKVFLSPNLPDIGATNKVLAFGDLSRFLIRAVSDSFTVFRYNELYMASHSYGFQAWWRAEESWRRQTVAAPMCQSRSWSCTPDWSASPGLAAQDSLARPYLNS